MRKFTSSEYIKYKEVDKTCPICSNKLFLEEYWLDVLDGNDVYLCENDETHNFWKHPFEMGNILHFNKQASQTSFDSEKDYVFKNGEWVESLIKF